MALISCKECGNQISNKADKCPSCGIKIKKPISLLAFLGILFILFAFIGSCLTEPKKNTVENADISKVETSKNIVKSDTSVIVKAQRLVKESAKDEDSVKFRDVLSNETKDFGLVACGQFNGKNLFGAMTGYTRFISNGHTLYIDGANDTTIPFSEMWIKACIK